MDRTYANPRKMGLMILGALLLYVLGLGPAALIGAYNTTVFRAMRTLYAPFLWTPRCAEPGVWAYCTLWLSIDGRFDDSSDSSKAYREIWLGREDEDLSLPLK